MKWKEKFQQLKADLVSLYGFAAHGVWDDESGSHVSKILRSLNLAVRCFLNGEVQQRACALTYRTVLAIVPALAILFAIARGFGLQQIVQDQLMRALPAQQQSLETAFSFVDSCLAQASGGVFVGVGLVLLLWTVVSMMDDVEQSFNKVWGVATERALYRKITDYTALIVFIPIFLVCSAGLSIFMSSVFQTYVPVALSPFLAMVLDVLPIVLIWLLFASIFWLVPNTKVKFKYALISGVLFGTAFFLLQLLFVEGQMFVSKYNAIYGSFAFLPLLLVWLQLSWMLVLMGAVMTYSLQNIYEFHYSHHESVRDISDGYLERLTMAMLAVIVKRFDEGGGAVAKAELSGAHYGVPFTLVNRIVDRLVKAGLIVQVVAANDEGERYQPALSAESITVAEVRRRLGELGSSHFIAKADKAFAQAYAHIDTASDSTLVKDLL